jgi:hypothetical protein
MEIYMKKVISLVLVSIIVVSGCLFSPLTASAEDAKIHSFVPVIDSYYPGVEDYIAKALRNKEQVIDVSEYGISQNNIVYAFKSAVFDNPDIFYVDASQINYKYNKFTGAIQYITPTYICGFDKIPSMTKKFNKAVKSFLSGISGSLSSFDKALIIHDRLAVHCEYKQKSLLSFTAYGCMVEGKAICEGYSRAFCYLMSKLGVESKTINNTSALHCWNYVKLSGKWYNVDITGDDPKPDNEGYVSHKYFLISDSQLKKVSTNNNHNGYMDDATFSTDYYCTSDKYNNSFTKRITSEIIKYKNSYYYFDNNYKNKHVSALIRRQNGKKKVITTINDKWMYKHKYVWNGSYCKLCEKGKYIYFNSKRSIYRFKKGSKKIKKIHTFASYQTKDLYGISCDGTYLLVTRMKSSKKNPKTYKVAKFTSGRLTVIPYTRYSSANISKSGSFKYEIYGGRGKTTYKSSSNKIAKVSKNGVIRGKKKGKCTVTAQKSGYKFKLSVRVK